MPFTPADLTALIQGNGFTLWHYRTDDRRTTVTAAGYFADVASRLRPGDIMLLQAGDSLAIVPFRTGPALGTGVTLDGTVGPLNTLRAISQAFSVSQAASVVVRTIVLAPIAAGIIAGSTIPVSASVAGPIAQVVFSLRDRTGALVPPAQTVSVAGGTAAASFPTPPVGSGYRIRAEDANDPNVVVVSRGFNIGEDLVLILQEDDRFLLTELGGALKQG